MSGMCASCPLCLEVVPEIRVGVRPPGSSLPTAVEGKTHNLIFCRGDGVASADSRSVACPFHFNTCQPYTAP